MHVCQDWRELASLSPRLWSFIVVDASSHPQALAAALSRSSQALLSVRIEKLPKDSGDAILQSLFQHLHRMQHLTIHVDFSTGDLPQLTRLNSALPGVVAPQLRWLYVRGYSLWNLPRAFDDQDASGTSLTRTLPCLKELIYEPPPLHNPGHFTPLPSSLTRLVIELRIPLQALLYALRTTQRLQYLELHGHRHTPVNHGNFLPEAGVHLPSLKKLVMIGQKRLWSNLCRQVNFPRTTKISFTTANAAFSDLAEILETLELLDVLVKKTCTEGNDPDVVSTPSHLSALIFPLCHESLVTDTMLNAQNIARVTSRSVQWSAQEYPRSGFREQEYYTLAIYDRQPTGRTSLVEAALLDRSNSLFCRALTGVRTLFQYAQLDSFRSWQTTYGYMTNLTTLCVPGPAPSRIDSIPAFLDRRMPDAHLFPNLRTLILLDICSSMGEFWAKLRDALQERAVDGMKLDVLYLSCWNTVEECVMEDITTSLRGVAKLVKAMQWNFRDSSPNVEEFWNIYAHATSHIDSTSCAADEGMANFLITSHVLTGYMQTRPVMLTRCLQKGWKV